MTVIGTGIFDVSFNISSPKTARISPFRKATSRPRLSPASVITEKCAVWTSIHLGSSLSFANAGSAGKKLRAPSNANTKPICGENSKGWEKKDGGGLMTVRTNFLEMLARQPADATRADLRHLRHNLFARRGRHRKLARDPVHDGGPRGAAFARRLTWPAPRAHVTLSSVIAPTTSRLAWIDWMRGLACVLMFQTHCYDAWLGGD